VVAYVLDYAAEIMRVGYRRNKYEQAAREVAQEYAEWRYYNARD